MWLEGNSLNEQQASNLYSSANIILWLKLPDVIAASSTDSNIYLAYFPTTTDEFSATGNYGAAPQLFCASGCPASSYAGADNGANVFSFYDNFAGTALSSKWTAVDNVGGTGSPSVNDGITLVSSVINTASSSYNPATLIIEAYGTTTNLQGGAQELIGTQTGTGWNPSGNKIMGMTNCAATETAEYPCIYTDVGDSQSSTVAPSGNYMNSVYLISGTGYYEVNYGQYELSESTSTSGNQYIALGQYGANNGYTFIQYVRTRIMPPNNVNPSVSFGSVQGTTELTISPNPATYGQSITITATCPISTDSCAIDYSAVYRDVSKDIDISL